NKLGQLYHTGNADAQEPFLQAATFQLHSRAGRVACAFRSGALAAARMESAQCATKNFFSVGRKVSAFPTNGRRAVVICRTTSTKTRIQVFRPAVERAWVCMKPDFKNLNPKLMAMKRNSRCSAPIQVIDSVDCENNQATGAKPTRRTVMSNSIPLTSPHTSAKRAWDPLKQPNM